LPETIFWLVELTLISKLGERSHFPKTIVSALHSESDRSLMPREYLGISSLLRCDRSHSHWGWSWD
jgi:hypothetical protein